MAALRAPVAGALALFAGGIAIAAQQPTFRAGINFVSVDALVADKNGNPVADLQPQDFDITEQGAPQKIETFKFISLDGGLMPGPDGPPRAIRSDDDERREAAREDVRLFAIFLDDYHVSRPAAIQVRDRIARFLQNSVGPSDMTGLMYPLTRLSELLMTRDHNAVEKGIEQFEGRKGVYDPKNPAEERAWETSGGNPAMLEMIRNQVSYTALEGLIQHLGGFKEGRKSLVLVSEGVPMKELDLQELWTQANRSNVSVYWIDPRMLSALSGPASLRATALQQDALRTLSLYTDGRAIVQSNDLESGLKQIVRDSSAYYLIGYNSTFTNADGKFHEISVRVKRSGVTVRARKGYWMLTNAEVAKAAAPPAPGPSKAIEDAVGAALGGSGSRAVQTWTGFEPGQNGTTRVTFVWDPVRPEAARVVLTASGADSAPYFRGPVASTRMATFDASPGMMTVRFSVEGPGANTLDSEVSEVGVPDFASTASVPTPRVFRARSARELQAIKTDHGATPTATREFNRTDTVLIRTVPSSTARLLSQTGQPVSELAVMPSSTAAAQAEVELPLSRIAPGDYVVAVNAHGVQQLIAFRIAR